MGRKKKYNSNEVIEAITSVFLQYGYEATSLDTLVKATGLLRGSLYSEFGLSLIHISEPTRRS